MNWTETPSQPFKLQEASQNTPGKIIQLDKTGMRKTALYKQICEKNRPLCLLSGHGGEQSEPACLESFCCSSPNESWPKHLHWAGRHPEQILKPPQQWRNSGSTLNTSRVTELLILSLRVCPATQQRKLIATAYIRKLVLLFMTQNSWP